MTRRSVSMRRRYERQYPIKVDVPAPDTGLGKLLDAMLSWRRENVDDWAQHGASVEGGRQRQEVARFYFIAEEDAEAFRRSWVEV